MATKPQTCARCRGLLVPQPCWEREFKQVTFRWGRPVYVWSCVNCGHRTDKTMEENRALQRQPVPISRHERIWRHVRNEVAKQRVA